MQRTTAAGRRIAALATQLTPQGSRYLSSSDGKPKREKIKAVIFDLGGVVLGSPLPAIRSFEKDAGIAPGSIFSASAKAGDKGAFQRLERGELALEEFFPIFTQELAENGVRPSKSVEEMFSRMESDLRPRPEFIMAIKSIRAEGLKTAALTNNWQKLSGDTLFPFEKGEMKALFDVVHESCKTGARKPSPGAYSGVLEALKLSGSPQAAVFLDDIGTNLKAAKELGINTIKVEEGDANQALDQLSGLLGFPLNEYVPGTKAVRSALRFDNAPLEAFLEGCGVEKLMGRITRVRQFGHGQSNPTYHVTIDGEREFVLRKKPPGKILRGAHAVEREFEVIKALGSASFPVPTSHVLCEDDAVIGTPFYMMDFVKGALFTDPRMPGCTGPQRAAAYDAMNGVLAGLHSIDPSKIGLENYGKHQGYYGRQVATWTKQYEAAKTREIPAMDELITWLSSHIPADNKPSVVHGDFRLDNLIFGGGSGFEVKAVLDWELSTIGDATADLAYNCLPYYLPPDFQIPGFAGRPLPEGVPTEEAYVKLYCQRAGMTDGIQNWNFYLGFAFFRIAAILQGVYKRALQGNASSSYAEAIGAQAELMAATGLKLAKTPRSIGV